MKRWMVISLLIALVFAVGLIEMVTAGTPEVGKSMPSSFPQASEDSWDSGWVPIGPDITEVFTHSLGGDPGIYGVALWFLDTGLPVNFGINGRAFGGMEDNGNYYGAYWHNLTDESVQVTRHAADTFVDFMRIRVWIPDPPDWDSGWQEIDPGLLNMLTLDHPLGGDVDDYVVGIRFRDIPDEPQQEGLGIHLRGIGGVEDGNNFFGAAYRDLTDSSIRVLRYGNDAIVDEVRVFINLPDPPDFDSDWQTIDAGTTEVISHTLGGNVNTYLVNVSARSEQHGVNSIAGGGLETAGTYLGSYWANLTNQAIDVTRYADDVSAEEVRVRIWKPKFIFLPLIDFEHSP